VPEPSAQSSLLRRGLDTSGGAAFVRERLRLLGKTVFLLSFSFYLALTGTFIVTGAPVLAVVLSPPALGHFLGSSMMGLLWLLARRPSTSLPWLGALDAFSVTLGCGFLSGMVVDESQTMQTLLAIMVTVLTRAILVPSTPGRTALLTAAAFVPTFLVSLILHHPTTLVPEASPAFQKVFLTLNTFLWVVLGTTLATISSRVTYGLRQQVREATDIGQYTLEEKIGGGGMGEVWRARHRLLIRAAAV